MSHQIILSGTTAVSAGMQEAVTFDDDGFVERGLVAKFPLEETSGTALVDSKGGASGVIDSIDSSNNAYTRLSGGGISISGAQLLSFPAFEQNSAWTLMTGVRCTNHTGTAGTEKIRGIIGSRNFGIAGAQRGVGLYQRGATDLSQVLSTAYYQHRAANGSGGQAAPEDLTPKQNVFNVGRVCMLSYDGATTVESRIYDKNANLLALDSLAVTAAQLFTIGGTTLSNIQWAVGGFNENFAGGIQQVEAAARYSRKISDFPETEISMICAAFAAKATTRGRAW